MPAPVRDRVRQAHRHRWRRLRRHTKHPGDARAARADERRQTRRPDSPARRGSASARSVPKAVGRPGRIATCQKSSRPRSAMTARTASYAPTETPPVVIMRSTLPAVSSTRTNLLRRIPRDAERDGDAAIVRDQGGEHRAVRVRDLRRIERLPRRDKFVARRKHGDTRSAHDRRVCVTEGSEQRDLPRPEQCSRREQPSCPLATIRRDAAHARLPTTAARMATRSVPPSVSSSRTTASAPVGSGAPVVIAAA